MRVDKAGGEWLEIVQLRSTNPQGESPLSWCVPRSQDGEFAEIRDEWWSATFGTFQSGLEKVKGQASVHIDFSAVEWIDPIPLLGILLTAKNFCLRTNSPVFLQLGSRASTTQRRNGFLKFLGQHGFLASLRQVERTYVAFDGHEYLLGDDSLLWAHLSAESLVLTYADSRCLTAKFLSIGDIGRATDREVSAVINPWLEEFRDYGLKPYFEGEAELVDDILHKVRVLLTEIVNNGAEHAYHGAENESLQSFAVYARVRRGADSGQRAKLLAEAIDKENHACPTLRQFHRDNHSSWIELFCVDEGRGLLADLEAWKAHADRELRTKLSRVKSQTNVLHQISQYLFQQPLTRHSRALRTTLTGLQHVRLVLSDGEDFARIYTAGEWAGAMHPWRLRTTAGSYNLRKQTLYSNFDSARGTAWHYCLRLEHSSSQAIDKRFEEWTQVTAADVEQAPVTRTPYKAWRIFDERDLGGGVRYCDWYSEGLNDAHSLWLPGAITKQHVYQWLTSLLSRPSTRDDPTVWLIGDLSREQAQTLKAVLISERFRGKGTPNLEVCVVTSDWHLLCLQRTRADRPFLVKSKEYCHRIARERGAAIFNLLRTHDSRLFWHGLMSNAKSSIGPSFVPEEVVWTRDPNGSPDVVLKGYLDLTQALVDPLRASVAARALRRTWYLYARDAECVAADALLTNLLPREARITLVEGRTIAADEARAQVVVSSIFVTGGTAERATAVGRQAIHLLRHTQFQQGHKAFREGLTSSSRFALNWLEEPVEIKPCPRDELPYERIPGTPYIGRGGPKAIPVRRFERKQPGGDYFERSIYQEPPQQTYDHFLSLGLLKLGHWVYGAHHDLATVNLALAVDRESLDHGPILKWLCTELQHLKGQGTDLVVYPSHAATEKMVQAIKKSGFSGISYDLPQHFVPVHFLGTHTQTAIRIPSLTYDRIQTFLREEATSEKKVVLLDDGALSGKVQRELEQLIRNAGAKSVIHLALITRTGLPLYRRYLLSEYRNTHKYYWRWDVPPLGNARTCPLCRALEQARELARVLWSDQARTEIEMWKTTWNERSVTTHWWRHGLAPARLPESREVTFGKEWSRPSGETRKYRIRHTTSTGLACTVAELVRITSYKDVGLTIAKKPWPQETATAHISWRHAQLEILICQTLLFFDDFDQFELDARFEMIFTTLLEKSEDTDEALERLCCLTLLLTSDRQARAIASNAVERLAKRSSLSLYMLIAFGLLARRGGLSIVDLRNRLTNVLSAHERITAEDHIAAAYALAQGEVNRGTRHALLTLIMLFGDSDTGAHTGFLRKRLTGEIKGGTADIARDLRLAAQAFAEIDPLVLGGATESVLNLEQASRAIEVVINKLDKRLRASQSATTEVGEAYQILFQDTNGIAKRFRSAFLASSQEITEYLRTAIGSEEWRTELARRRSAKGKRWGQSQDTVLPTFRTAVAKHLKGEEIVVFPPVARQMIHDCLLNVWHSDVSYTIDNEPCDMICDVSISDEVLLINLRNHAAGDASKSSRKASESIVSQQLLNNPVTRRFDATSKEMIVTVKLPLVADLGKSNS
ncbi:hypothetical protein HY346_01320 [Candidatus Microgenomates bacterium]|nr:hypothetical protein [Candidatus Microgenomates bacterium]